MRYICTSIVATCMLAGSTFAATINVPGDYSTIQGAIDASSDGDEIIVAPGTYTSSGNEVVNTFGKAITIKASGTPEETIIDGENERRVILCNAGETAGTAIEGFTITRGSVTSGSGGSNRSGAGIFCGNSSPTITGCTISNNAAGWSAGGICCNESSPTITDCTITGNTAAESDGGGINCSYSSHPMITGCTITNNTANGSWGGGGITCYESSTPTFSNCTISDNTAPSGGGISCYNSGNPTITDCTISNNTATGSGGGIYCHNSSNATLTDTLLCGNAPDAIYGPWTDGGGVAIYDDCFFDCNDNGIQDSEDIANFTSFDCDQNGVPDECQPDCDGDGWIDPCDSEGDIDGDGIPDNCEDDCNDNGIPDDTELKNGWATDCNGNGILDECDIASDPSLDCDGNGALDSCEIEDDQSLDCNGNGTLDECDLGGQGPEGAVQWAVEEGGNGHWYQIAIANGDCFDEIRLAALSQFGDLAVIESLEENQFITALLIPDGDYWIGLTQNLESPQYSEPGGGWEWIDGTALVYENWDSDEPNNGGSIGEDACGIFYDGTWYDMESCDFEGDQYAVIEWDAGFFSLDCNANDIPDECDIADGTSNDVNDNGIPDECEDDCNGNGVPDHWDIKTGTSEDCNANGIPDECDTADGGGSNDVNGNSIPDECEADCNGNGSPDDWDVVTGWSEDCNDNLIPDECELAAGQSPVESPAEGAVQWTVAEGGNGHWYMGVNDFVTWSTASSNAQQQGGYLATCTTVEENTFVQAVRDADTTLGGAWIGLVQLPEGSEPNGGWEWVTGEPLDWTNWTAGQPNNSDNKGAEADYGEMCCHSDGWGDWTDGHPMPYIIEWGAVSFSLDCNTNGILDECDIADETSEDINGDGVPDECQCLADIDGSGAVAIDDILAVSGYWGSSNPVADLNGDGIVAIQDLLIVISEWGPCP